MKKKDQKSQRQIKVNTKSAQPKRWRRYLMTGVCGLLLVSGFFLAGRQHFSTMDYGMKNSKLRRQIEELESEKRRLLLAREVSLSPAEIKKSAKKTGIIDSQTDTQLAQVASVTKDKAVPPVSATTSNASEKASDAKPLIIKTAAVTATSTRLGADNADVRSERIVKTPKRPNTTTE